MTLTRRLRALLTGTVAAASVVGLATSELAFATASFSNSVVTCSITANLPSLTGNGITLTGSASITCRASTSTTVTVTVQVVEMNGAVVNTMNNVFYASATQPLTAGQSKTWTVTTLGKICINTDGTGKEDYYTVGTVVQSKSSAKEQVGKVDGWDCKA